MQFLSEHIETLTEIDDLYKLDFCLSNDFRSLVADRVAA